MTFKVNIEQGTSLYTTDEIISYGLSGCLYAGDTDLTAFVEQIVTHYETKCLADQMSVDVYGDERYNDGYADAVEEMKRCLENM